MTLHTVLTRVTPMILIAALTGCATNAQTGSVAGGAAGCALGLLLDKGNKHQLAKCAEGAAPLALAGYYLGRQRDLQLARDAAMQISNGQPGQVAVQLRTANLMVPQENRASVNNAASIESLDTMLVSVPQPQVKRMDPQATRSLARVGKYLADSQGNARVTVSAQSQQDYDFIVSSVRGGYGRPLAPQKVVYQYRPLTRGTQALVEVTPVA